MYTNQDYARRDLLAVIYPASYTTVQDSGWVDVSTYHRVVVEIFVGAIAATGTLDVDVEQATDTSGAGAKNITGKSITQLTDADGDDPIKIEIRMSELDTNNRYDAINVEATPLVAASIFAIAVYGIIPRFAPVPTTLYTEIID